MIDQSQLLGFAPYLNLARHAKRGCSILKIRPQLLPIQPSHYERGLEDKKWSTWMKAKRTAILGAHILLAALNTRWPRLASFQYQALEGSGEGMVSVPWTPQGRISVTTFCDSSRTVTEPGPTSGISNSPFLFSGSLEAPPIKDPRFSGNLGKKAEQEPWMKISSCKAEQIVGSWN